MAQVVQKTILDNKVNLIVRDTLTAIGKHSITLASGQELPSDIVIMAIGVKADTTLARKSGIKLGKTGSIQVNQSFQTNLPHVYAVGDAIEVYSRLLRRPTRLNLAFPAQLQARQAVDHLIAVSLDHNVYPSSIRTLPPPD